MIAFAQAIVWVLVGFFGALVTLMLVAFLIVSVVVAAILSPPSRTITHTRPPRGKADGRAEYIMPNDTKPAIQSVGIWGSSIALLSLIAPYALPHLGLSAADVQTAIGDVSTIGVAVGSLAAMWGRWRASQPISGVVKGAGQ